MKVKPLLKWQFFLGIFIGLILGAVLATFLYMKNIDLGDVRKRQVYLIQEVEKLRKERQELTYIFKERELIEDWNKDAVIVPKEEGK